jgi:UDP-N-acetylglucosamine 2-epimerase
MKTIVTVLGTRPEIIKFSPLLPIFDRRYRHILVHTGQHYDENMDRIFFRELRLKTPKHFLNVGSGSQALQTARMLERLEPILIKSKPNFVTVLGDTNSTLAGALVAAKLNIPVAHIEAGCRSFNWSMPEEKNRVLVDHVSTLLFAPDTQAVTQLKQEGISNSKVHLVGNTGLDATRRTVEITSDSRLKKFGVKIEGYALATIHRAENTDHPQRFRGLISALNDISKSVPILFPIHPRTVAVLKKNKIRLGPGIRSLPPLGNLDFIALLKNSLFILSDSGGVQEEAAVVNRPCLILREDTEWKRLVDAGKNFLVGIKPKQILRTAEHLVRSTEWRQKIRKKKAPLPFGATQKIIRILDKS